MPVLSITKTYKDGDILFALDLDNTCDSIETFLNGPNLDEVNVQASVLSALLFTGMIVLYGKATPPTGWLLCDGSVVSQVTYGNLFAVLGATYGAPGGGNFSLPDFRRAAPMGPGGVQVSASAPGITLGSSGGEEAHTVLLAELPVHSHDDSPGHTHGQRSFLTGSNGAEVATHSVTTLSSTLTANRTVPNTQTTGGSGAHNNMQPSLISCFIIKT